MKKYDVIIAGAGLAGLCLAKGLAGSGLKVLVLDKKSAAGDIKYHSSGTFMNPAQYGLPLKFAHKIGKVSFCSANEKCEKHVKDCYVIDRVKLYKWLEKKAEAEFKYSCNVTAVTFEKGLLRSIKYAKNGKKHEAEAGIFVDCSGLNAVLAGQAGLTAGKCVIALGYEELVPLEAGSDSASLFVGKGLGGGYGWIFPKNRRTAIVGAGVIRKELFGRIKQIYRQMWQNRAISSQCAPNPIDCNYAALRSGNPLKKFVQKNLVILGDSALQANPLIGEGIRFIMDAALMAATAIKAAAASESPEKLKEYENNWHKAHYTKFKAAFFMQNVLKVVTMNDWILDKGVKVLRSCSEADYRRVLSADISIGFFLRIFFEAVWKIKILGLK
jgi:digeranylgeranylglycerophospholipid reductase